MRIEFKNSQTEILNKMEEKMEKIFSQIEQKNNEIKELKKANGRKIFWSEIFCISLTYLNYNLSGKLQK